MTRNEINAAMEIYNEAGRVFDGETVKYNAARDVYFGIKGKASAADDAAFIAARDAYAAARKVYDAAFLIASELPEIASDDIVEGDDSADQMELL